MSSLAQDRAEGDLLSSLHHHARRRGDSPAVEVGGALLTYRELDVRSRQLASLLVDNGVGEGSRVAFLGKESTDYYAMLFAAARLMAVLVPVNRKLTSAEVHHILEDSDASVVVADSGQAQADGIATPVLWSDSHSFLTPDERGDLPQLAPGPDTPVAQLYTSGTTGLPKGVVLAHRSFFAVLASLEKAGLDWIAVAPEDRCLVGIPGFHVGGLWFACQGFNAGAHVIGLPDFEAAAVRRTILDRAVTSGIFVPAMLRSLLDAPSAGPNDFVTLERTIYGGAPISDSLLERCVAEIGGRFSQIYGLTETGNTAVCLPPHDHVPGSSRLRAAGRPYPCVEVEIRDDDGTALPPETVGEVWLRTPAAMVEYWRRPDATAATLRDGWVRTGDAGRLDPDGYLYLHDRLNDMIIVGGENVYPAEVENVLARHPDVADVAVVGVPDDTTGESVMAYVQLRTGAQLSTRALLMLAREHLAAFKLPRRYVEIDQVPRNPSGKILRRELREPHWSGHDRRVH